MAKWGDKWQGKKGERQTGLETEVHDDNERRTDGETGGPGNQNDAKLAVREQIAKRADEMRNDDLQDISGDDYAHDGEELSDTEKQELANRRENPGGKVFPRVTDNIADEAADENEEKSADEKDGDEGDGNNEEEKPAARTYKLKINGVETEVSETELLARAQKVSAADQYLAEAAKIYSDAKNPDRQTEKKDDGAKVEEDYLALARAIQMGTEEDAVNAIKKIATKPSLSKDEVVSIADSRFEQRNAFQRDLNRFTADYKDLLADENAKALVFELDESYNTKGETPGYDRFKKAADAVQKILGVRQSSTTMSDKEQRKASVKVVTGSGARQVPRTEEKDPTPGEVIANMAKARGQFAERGGN